MVWVVSTTFDTDIDDVDLFDQWEAALTAFDGSVSRRPRVLHVDESMLLCVTLYIDAYGPAEAVGIARSALHPLVGDHPIVTVEVVDEELYIARAAAPTLPVMVSASEAADILDVSRQRVHQLRSTAGFPSPLFELRTGPIWARSAIAAFERSWTRRPGPRPAPPIDMVVKDLRDAGAGAPFRRIVTGTRPAPSPIPPTRRSKKNSLRPVD